jgi:uncharacterized DUF497 family protein
MEITADPAKDATNLAKHGLSLLEAEAFDWDVAMIFPDSRRDYGEARMVALIPSKGRLFFVVFVDRPPEQPTERRIISVRKANVREVKRYADND